MLSRLLLLFAASLLATEPRSAPLPDAQLEFVNPVTYEITQRITVANHDVSALDLLELNLPIPLDWREQDVGHVTIKGDRPFRLRDVHEGGMIVRSRYLGPKALPGPGQKRSLTVAYRVTRKEIRTDAKRLASRKYEPYDERSQLYRLNMRSEKLIETDAREIMLLAEKLKVRTEGPYHFARAAYDYVVEHCYSPEQSGLFCTKFRRAPR